MRNLESRCNAELNSEERLKILSGCSWRKRKEKKGKGREVIDRHPDGGSVLLRIEGRETMNSRQIRYLLGVNIWSMNFMKYVILLRGEELIGFNVLGKYRSIIDANRIFSPSQRLI